MSRITKITFKCDKCGKEKTYLDIDIVAYSYNQYVIDVLDQDEKYQEARCECENDEG